jgi:hypothetical protein
MDAERIERAARMLPNTAPLIPVEAQSPKHAGQTGLASGRSVQPNTKQRSGKGHRAESEDLKLAGNESNAN